MTKVLVWLWLASCVALQAAPAQDSLRVASYNLRYANPGDGANAWSHRKALVVFSVHFDHQGVVARQESAKLLLRKIKDIAGDNPVVCVGDFNSTPDTEQMATMRKALRDARDHSAAPPYGPQATFNGFQWNTAPKERIDYIYVNNAVRVLNYATLSDSQDRRYPSDHFPVVADVVLVR